jgi:NADH-quinone oxidoreductase subunit E
MSSSDRQQTEPALPAELAAEIAALARQYDDKRAACVEALKLLQQHYHWVDDARLEALARLLDMSVDELDGVATYYNLIYRRPVGRHVILLCDSVSCWLRGQERLRARLEQQLGIALGQTTSDQRFTLLPIVCLGHCDHAPALMIDQTLHGDVEADAVGRLLETYR